MLSFINLYPHLVDHLGLYHEVLFEIGSDHFSKGIYDEFVELLLKIREEYPYTYKKSFEYYDSDLIYWYTAQGRLDEIDAFFDYFREKNTYYDQLDDLIDFFFAINRPDIILNSFSGSKEKTFISWIISCNIIQKYIDCPATDESIQCMLDEIEKEGIMDKEDTIEYHKKNLVEFTRPFTPWEGSPKKRSQAYRYCDKIYRNFMYFLYKNTELSFVSASVFALTINKYYDRIISQNKRPSDMFCLDKKSITDYLVYNYDTVLWGFKMQCFIALNAFYLFADYLTVCGNMSEGQKKSTQEMFINMFQNGYEASKIQGPEMMAFAQFPLWTIK